MRTILILCLVLFVAFSFGCSKKKEEAPKIETAQQRDDLAGKVAYAFDPVSNQDVDPATAQYSFEYNGVLYGFVSEENMKAFKADPEKYITTAPPQRQQAAPPQENQ